jgi:hypothetical protein
VGEVAADAGWLRKQVHRGVSLSNDSDDHTVVGPPLSGFWMPRLADDLGEEESGLLGGEGHGGKRLQVFSVQFSG